MVGRCILKLKPKAHGSIASTRENDYSSGSGAGASPIIIDSSRVRPCCQLNDMTRPVFETFWRVNGQEIYDPDEVARLVVEEGHIAVESTAQQQLNAWNLRQAQERWHRQAIDRHAKHVAEQAHRDSPEGKRQAAVQYAAQRPGGIVTSGTDGCPELDAFGVSATNKLR